MHPIGLATNKILESLRECLSLCTKMLGPAPWTKSDPRAGNWQQVVGALERTCAPLTARPCCTEKFHQQLLDLQVSVLCHVNLSEPTCLSQIVPVASRSGLLVPGTLSSSNYRSTGTVHDRHFSKHSPFHHELQQVSDVVLLGL